MKKGVIRFHGDGGELGALAKRLLNVGKEVANRKNNDAVRNMQRLVWLVVMASGGKVTISPHLLQRFDPTKAMITTYTDPETGGSVYEAKDSRDV